MNSITIWGYFFLLIFQYLKTVIYFLIISFLKHTFGKFSDVLPAFTCTSANDNLWSISLGVYFETCAMGLLFIGNNLLSKLSKTFCQCFFIFFSAFGSSKIIKFIDLLALQTHAGWQCYYKLLSQNIFLFYFFKNYMFYNFLITLAVL